MFLSLAFSPASPGSRLPLYESPVSHKQVERGGGTSTPSKGTLPTTPISSLFFLKPERISFHVRKSLLGCESSASVFYLLSVTLGSN